MNKNEIPIDVMVKATNADNWKCCEDCGGSGMELRGSIPQPQGGECSTCVGTGKVLKGAE